MYIVTDLGTVNVLGRARLKRRAVAIAKREARRNGEGAEIHMEDKDHRGHLSLFMQAKVYPDGEVSKV
jgi:hypothetical protein